jgi:hypothetical protein
MWWIFHVLTSIRWNCPFTYHWGRELGSEEKKDQQNTSAIILKLCYSENSAKLGLEDYWVAFDFSFNCQRLTKDDELPTVQERLFPPRNGNTTRRLQWSKYLGIKRIRVGIL